MKSKLPAYAVIGIFLLISFFVPHITFWILLFVGAYYTVEYFQEQILTKPENDTSKLTAFQYEKQAYMKSKTWKQKREIVIRRDDFQCQLCSTNEHLVVHHMKDYMLIPHEPTSSLITLCWDCHQEEHDRHEPLNTFASFQNWNHPITKEKT